MKRIVYTLCLASVLVGCSQDELKNPLDTQLKSTLEYLSPEGTLDHFILPESDDYANIPNGKNNPLTKEKVELGKLLFYETAIARAAVKESGLGTYSCSSCHLPSAGFMPGRIQGIADGGVGMGNNGEIRTIQSDYNETELDVQGARALSLLNVAFVTNTTWSGKFGAYHANEGTEQAWGEIDPDTEINHLGLDGLESQNIEGLHLHRMVVDDYVLDELGYRHYYDAAFGDWPEDERYGDIATSFAISAYLRTLLTTEAPFQRYLKGEETALTEVEKAGAVLFYGKAGCYRCHKGAALNATEFYALGVNDLYQTEGAFNTGPAARRNFGRGGFTGEESDMFKFKVPGIYNMGDSPFYFHGSSKRSLREVVEYFNDAVAENPRVPESQLAPHFQPLSLTETEIDQLTEFLDGGLRDPNLERYVPQQVLSGNCFPNNDPQSKADMGCH